LLYGDDISASKALRGVGDEAGKLGEKSMKSVQAVGAAVALAVAAIAVLSVKNAMAMQESDAKIQGNAQISKAAAVGIGDAFLATAGKSTFSGKAMADAFGPVAGVIQTLAGHTLNAADAMTVMNASTMLAEATGNSLDTTTADLAAVMQSFGIKLSGASDAANVLFNTSRLTNVGLDTLTSTVDKLHGKLGIAAPSLTDTSALIDDLANHGIAGSRGLMVVNTALTTLLGGSKATTAELKTLGISVFDSSGKFVGMKGVLEQLTPKLKDMTQQQQLAAEKALFGGAAAKALNSTILAGVPAYDAARAAVTKHGAAESAAQANANTLQGQLKTLRAAFDDITTSLGEKLIPKLTDAVTWMGKNKTAVAIVASVIGGVLLTALAAWLVMMVAIAAANIAATWEILLVVAAIAVLAAGVIYCWTQFQWFRTIVTDVFHGVQVVIGTIVSTIIGFFKGLFDAFMWVIGGVIHLAAMIPGPWQSAMQNADRSVSNFRAGVDQKMGAMQAAATGWGSQTGGNYAAGLGSQVGHAAAVGSSVASGVRSGLAFSAFGIGASVAASYASGISAGGPALTAMAVAVAGSAQAAMASALKPPGKAAGGPVLAGHMYTVNENGQETFVPATNGYIIPHGASAGGSTGAGGSNQPIIVQMVLDGRVLHQSLLKQKRDTGGGLGLG
jgi:TP901 family phage tail tape measure protein